MFLQNVPTSKSRWRHNPEDQHRQLHCPENLRSLQMNVGIVDTLSNMTQPLPSKSFHLTISLDAYDLCSYNIVAKQPKMVGLKSRSINNEASFGARNDTTSVICPNMKQVMYRVITKDVSDYITLLVRK
jgi:hypothetical protein